MTGAEGGEELVRDNGEALGTKTGALTACADIGEVAVVTAAGEADRALLCFLKGELDNEQLHVRSGNDFFSLYDNN